MRINSELMDAQLENKASDVTPATTAKGLIYYKSTTEPIKVSDGTTIHKVLTDQMWSSIADGVEGLVQVNQSQVTANYAIASSNSGSYTNSTTSYTDVTNQSVSITTTGKPVEITLVNGTVSIDGVGAGNKKIILKVLRGATDLDELTLASNSSSTDGTTVPASTFRWIDTPVAGTYTYKLQAKLFAVHTGSVTNVKIFVKELV